MTVLLQKVSRLYLYHPIYLVISINFKICVGEKNTLLGLREIYETRQFVPVFLRNSYQ